MSIAVHVFWKLKDTDNIDKTEISKVGKKLQAWTYFEEDKSNVFLSS